MNQAGRILTAAIVLELGFSALLWYLSSEVYLFIIMLFIFAIIDVIVAAVALVGVGVKEAFA